MCTKYDASQQDAIFYPQGGSPCQDIRILKEYLIDILSDYGSTYRDNSYGRVSQGLRYKVEKSFRSRLPEIIIFL